MHGIIGKMMSVPDGREALIRILLDASRNMPGCLSYVVARDTMDENALWITEVWESREAHKQSIGSTDLHQAIAECKHLISGFGHRFETRPAGGQGLPSALSDHGG